MVDTNEKMLVRCRECSGCTRFKFGRTVDKLFIVTDGGVDEQKEQGAEGVEEADL